VKGTEEANLTEKCPPECQVKLNNFFNQINELKETDKKQWEVFDTKIVTVEAMVIDRVKTKTLVAIFGVIVTIFLVIMSMTFTTLHSSQKMVQTQLSSVEREMVKVSTKLDIHTDDHNGDK
jgi:hypothetical protein